MFGVIEDLFRGETRLDNKNTPLRRRRTDTDKVSHLTSPALCAWEADAKLSLPNAAQRLPLTLSLPLVVIPDYFLLLLVTAATMVLL